MTASSSPQIAAAASKALAGNHGLSLISDEKLLALYEGLLHCLAIEERLQKLSPARGGKKRGEFRGLEASVVAVAMDLHREDSLIAPPCGLIHAFMKGAPLERIAAALHACAVPADWRDQDRAALAEWKVSRTTSSDPAAQINAAISAALRHKIDDDGKIVAAFLAGDAVDADSTEALRFAAAQQLPVLFVLHLSAPHDHKRGVLKGRQYPAPGLKGRIPDYGFPCLPVDGADMVALYRAASESIARMRQGRGPALLECIDVADGMDPVAKMEVYLDRKGLYRQEFKDAVNAAFAGVLKAAFAATGAAGPRRRGIRSTSFAREGTKA
jgi:pyruvate dehydrogenase E1 component alpha subunit/2-oxoisovalerate dehydrogenase E1 component alpha subunit